MKILSTFVAAKRVSLHQESNGFPPIRMLEYLLRAGKETFKN